jgi:hypothetical protein
VPPRQLNRYAARNRSETYFMTLTREIIESKLSDFMIPQGERGPKAFEIAGVLFNEQISPFSGNRFSSVPDALADISNALGNHNVSITWVDTGPMHADNQNYRALHCYFVFADDPWQCFSVWDSPGPVFYDADALTGKLVETIRLFGGVEIHTVPHRPPDVVAR